MIITMVCLLANSLGTTEGDPALVFERVRIGDTTFEACGVVDVDKDGHKDIVSGMYWHAGPDFSKRHKICDILQEGDYFDDFSNFPMDVNGDGYDDIITGAWWGLKLRWRENPKGKPVEWVTHDIAETGNIERPAFYDIDGDGELECIPDTTATHIFKLVRDEDGKGTGEWKQYTVGPDGGHGIGFGDVDGDGRADIIHTSGYLKQPENPYSGEPWENVKGPFLGMASVPILAHDVNGDGKNDLIVGQGHDYGLHWWEQQDRDAEGNIQWYKHDIETDKSQFHELQLVDLDNDGEDELITGKRYRAHGDNDPGAADPVGLYYYEINGGDFIRHTLNFGPAEENSGTGIYMWIEDLDGNGWKDIVAPGKEGLFVFWNKGKAAE